MVKNINFDKVNGIIDLKDNVDLPPNDELKIFLWGEFLESINNLIVNYEDGEAKIEYVKTFSGIKATFSLAWTIYRNTFRTVTCTMTGLLMTSLLPCKATSHCLLLNFRTVHVNIMW